MNSYGLGGFVFHAQSAPVTFSVRLVKQRVHRAAYRLDFSRFLICAARAELSAFFARLRQYYLYTKFYIYI